MEFTHIKAWWIGATGLGSLVGATVAVALFPGAAFAKNPTGEFGWHLVGFALSVGISFALAQWLVLRKALAGKKAISALLSAQWLVFSSVGIVALLFPLWWLDWGQVILQPYLSITLMVPGSFLLGHGQRLVLGRIGESGNRYVVDTCFGVAIGGYLGLIGAFLLWYMSDALFPLNHTWAMLFGLVVGAFQCHQLERAVKSVGAPSDG